MSNEDDWCLFPYTSLEKQGGHFAEDSHHRLAVLVHLMHIGKIVELVQHFEHMIGLVPRRQDEVVGPCGPYGCRTGYDELLARIFVDSSLWPKYLSGEMVSNYLLMSYGVVEKLGTEWKVEVEGVVALQQ
ncbi:hypothetical protein L6452_40400 [Arctium lappa]|uniref:Uncharacterized protein n=1 Tax=Arctium lappa TaxID=4217 RepID=A0ACB8XN08_ARCLA|nr:hypothetical protein L6452_40400 [Arctium lappa]